MSAGIHIVLIGLNICLEKQEGDKNFWVELLPYLSDEVSKITILSIKDHHVSVEKKYIGGCEIMIKYFPPHLIAIGEAGKNRLINRKGGFPAIWGVLEKILSVKKICAELKRLHREEPYHHIHLMDNMGIGNRIIAASAKTEVSVSAMAYQGKFGLLYDKYLLLSYRHTKLTIVPYSKTYAEKLQSIGIPRERIRQIKWGVDTRRRPEPAAGSNNLERLLSVPAGKCMYLWAGYLQQIRRKEFLLAYKCAIKALAGGLDGIFYFAFKLEAMAEEFKSLNNPVQGIHVKATTVDEFKNLQQRADIFYSPFGDKNIIIAPPLTWIEVLNYGRPVLTTVVRGADEIIVNGKTGFMARDEDDIVEKMFDLQRGYKGMREDCLKMIRDKYDIANSAAEYLSLFRGGGQ
ncbi:MAG: glycosyltransferase [Candidatus Erginobacter occultus]|nr:glycosyltransferase [Candidatus Erginobacter occultus]